MKSRKLNIWICLGIAGIIFSLNTIAGLLAFRLQIVACEYLNFSYYNIALKGFSLIVFVISFLLAALCVRNKKHIIWFVLLYSFTFFLPSLMGVPAPSNYTPLEERNIVLMYSVYSFLTIFVDSCFAIVLYLGFDWFNKQKQTKELEKQNLQSELMLLKNQLNPHFLFNTLNNIDSLIKRNPDYASSSIIELSDMMRYMIYETNADKVPLQKELDYIDNYLKLQKLQYANQKLVQYDVMGSPGDITIAPMLFIAFIENAFKHCTNKELRHAIRFSFRIEKDKIYFESVNNADETRKISKDLSSGIGLETVKRRLEILYPNRYTLVIQQKNDLFCVSLTIMLHD